MMAAAAAAAAAAGMVEVGRKDWNGDRIEMGIELKWG